ncbi:MAG: hypothetical protein WCB48_01490 [Casimicrobiaceae bacterium]
MRLFTFRIEISFLVTASNPGTRDFAAAFVDEAIGAEDAAMCISRRRIHIFGQMIREVMHCLREIKGGQDSSLDRASRHRDGSAAEKAKSSLARFAPCQTVRRFAFAEMDSWFTISDSFGQSLCLRPRSIRNAEKRVN